MIIRESQKKGDKFKEGFRFRVTSETEMFECYELLDELQEKMNEIIKKKSDEIFYGRGFPRGEVTLTTTDTRHGFLSVEILCRFF